MHEFNIGQTIVDVTLKELEKLPAKPKKVIAVRVAIGMLRAIVPEYLKFAYESLSKDTPAEGSTLEIRIIPVQGKCSECDWTGDLQTTRFICPQCKSTTGNLIGGRDMYLENMEIEDDE
jgi:hydrogenase nickel incorporation protein HypA/HybF